MESQPFSFGANRGVHHSVSPGRSEIQIQTNQLNATGPSQEPNLQGDGPRWAGSLFPSIQDPTETENCLGQGNQHVGNFDKQYDGHSTMLQSLNTPLSPSPTGKKLDE